MNEFQAIILGLIQGITEFLPISSSGHLIFVPKLFGWSDQGLAFDVVVHLGTLLAVMVFFWKKIKKVCSGFCPTNTTQRKLLQMLLVSIIPAGIVGFLWGDAIEQTLRSPLVIGVGLIVWGVVLGIADWYGRTRSEKKDMNSMSWKDALFISCAQAVALIPGTSRSGITMTAGLFSKLDKKSAAEFSFLMSIPVIAIAGALKMIELFQSGFAGVSISVLSAGFIASALSGFVAIAGLMKIIQKWSFMPFVVYRVVVGVLILIYLV